MHMSIVNEALFITAINSRGFVLEGCVLLSRAHAERPRAHVGGGDARGAISERDGGLSAVQVSRARLRAARARRGSAVPPST